jgi:hypothetical protein
MNLRSRWQSIAPGVSPGIAQKIEPSPLWRAAESEAQPPKSKELLTVRQSLTAHRAAEPREEQPEIPSGAI